MRKSFIALALLVGAAAIWTTLVFAQDTRVPDEGVKLMNARIAQMQLTRASRLGTAYTGADTVFIGHTTTAPYSLPWHIGAGPYRPGVGGKYDNMWDFDTYDGGAIDSMQGWIPTVTNNTRSSGTISDDQRPWQCLDWGNKINPAPVQGRTPGIVSAWHVDGGVNQPSTGYAGASPTWTPLNGNASAWCGLRSGDDNAVIESVALGGTGNAINGETVVGIIGDGTNNTQHNFPGYCNQWDQMLYRDVRVASGGALTVSFLYKTKMDPRNATAAASCKGWFDRDPLSLQQGGTGVGASNFISSSAYLGTPAASGPVDSFMVYVGVPSNPTACRYTDGGAARPIYDLKRRWFSEVIAVDKPYKEILSTFGTDEAYASSPYSFSLDNSVIQPMLTAQGAGDGGGVLRIVFRSKTNANYADETNTGGSFVSDNSGAVRIDDVAITGATPAFTTSTFEAASEINNTIEPANSATPGPAVGQGYAFAAWHSTGKPPKFMVHTHPLFGGDIGGGNYYAPLAYADLCGPPDSPIRQCNINNVVISTGDHDLGEAAGGAVGTPFKENRSGFLSPTINLVTPVSGYNDIGLDRVHATSNAKWYFYYDTYTGIFTPTQQGNVWGNSVQSWPAVQKNGAKVWGDIGYITGVWSNGDKQCFLMTDLVKPCIFTSNPSGIPDSMRIWIFREQRCISWGVTTGCSPTDGHYVDNVALCIPPPLAGVSDQLSVDIWDWYTDAFPANETNGLPGTAAFDTAGAFIQNGRNNSITTGNTSRFDCPGDSMYVKTQNATGTPLRCDLVFRVYPGPGNYVVAGNKASGLRKVPQSPVAAVSGDASFWGQYMLNQGEFASTLHHSGSVWNPDAWNSARLDTVEANIFPVDGKAGNLPGIQVDFWQSTLHESDPHFATLGILKNRCFLIDTSGASPLNSLNITCGDGAYPPVWLSDPAYQVRAGYDAVVGPQTREYTKVFPDGLFTAGSHIQYFFRMSHISTPTTYVMDPDTNRIFPQPIGSATNFDRIRWEHISILPDKWKDAAYGGFGSACMLVVDYNSRRGDDGVWAGACDSIGATAASKYGSNGWHATSAYLASDGSHDYSNELNVGSDPTIAVWGNKGQAGTTWDLYKVHAAESSTTGTCQIGSRLANRANMGYQVNKQSMQGPTPEMLRTYYKLVFIMTGDLNNAFFGAVTDRGQDDFGIMQDFLTYGANESTPRGVWVMGNGFVETEDGLTAQATTFLANDLAVSLRDPDYFALSGSVVAYPDLIPSTVVTTSGNIYSFQNSCLFTNDVLNVNTAVSGATPATWYQNLGSNGPYVSGVYAPSTSAHPYVSLVNSWDMYNMFSRQAGNTVGRLQYFMNVLTNVFGSVCPFIPAPTVDVPTNTARTVDFLGNIWGNPMVSGGKAAVHFGLAKSDRVEVKVYDVTGRLVRSLADRNFQAGEHTLTWDGTNDQGQVVSRGVYFTQVKFINSRFVDAKKVTVLK